MAPEHLSLAISVYIGVTAGGFLFAWAWEDGAPLRPWPDAASRRRHLWRNLAMLALVVVFADFVVAQGLLGIPARLFDPPDGALTPLGLPTAALVVVALVACDLYEYAAHRLVHAWRPLWLLHAVHHADPHVDFSTGARHHPVETAIVIAGRFALYIGLGLPLWVEALRASVVNLALTLQHANVVFPPGLERLRWLLVTPAVHRVHHGADRPYTDRNFGQFLTIWDRIFGTYAEPAGDAPAVYGLRRLAGERWQTIAGMLATPLAARRIDGPL